MQFTDDSVMTRSIAQSLIEKRQLDLLDIAKRFVKSYYEEPNRGYGPAVMTVFEKLRANRFSDLFTPAKEQFNGQGSWGNGGAMRITPIALFSHQNIDLLLEMTRKETQLTHTNKIGVDGAILQAIAIRQSLLLNPDNELDVKQFIDDLISQMDTIEFDEEGLGLVEPKPYKIQLSLVKTLISEGEAANAEKVVQKLGTSVAALYSVPTAIYCFLRAQNQIEGIITDNPFRRTIQYAISLGGDTDTIGGMAGALAGAFYGDKIINPAILKHLEASEEFQLLGEKLSDVTLSQ
ncbi:poly(ADP-ribose) glycohydrolase ARH3 isoform X2 [Cephus cinctus]|nr:poly(ADP-ribose) glycohydrolase ARH3 isoform X2 [Cephus cinctus]XP_024943512.1 poly(ADP-ribose) glycohydrolase ARH3 isoform X2 [Cephus cinctus]